MTSATTAFDTMASIAGRGRVLRIGVINNMPDAAVVRTEAQFSSLFRVAAGDADIEFTFYSLPVVARSGAMRDHVASRYMPIDELWNDVPDVVVVTGTEPRERDLKDEPYWAPMVELIDGLDDRGIPTMFSCLAAHLAVLRLDDVERIALDNKCFGVFQEAAFDHALMDGTEQHIWLPHTRWNQVNEADLLGAGYQILSRSREAGVGFFAKERRAPWLFCQGHPEYDGANLLREYRRDVVRYLSHERAIYPDVPSSYFGRESLDSLLAFKAQAFANRNVQLAKWFPRVDQRGPTWDAWQPAAVRIIANWLRLAVPMMVDCGTATSAHRTGAASGNRADFIIDTQFTQQVADPALSNEAR
jgi:homoserine O-succinyltransferase